MKRSKNHLICDTHLVAVVLYVRCVVGRGEEHVESRERINRRKTEEITHEDPRGNQLQKVLEDIVVYAQAKHSK